MQWHKGCAELEYRGCLGSALRGSRRARKEKTPPCLNNGLVNICYLALQRTSMWNIGTTGPKQVYFKLMLNAKHNHVLKI